VVAERGEEGIERVRELTGGDGTHAVVECVGTRQSLETALGVVGDGGVVSRLGVWQYAEVPMGFDTLVRNITLTELVAEGKVRHIGLSEAGVTTIRRAYESGGQTRLPGKTVLVVR
jgi:threonine dehydrogenase-like Zn-dependent dehydrogenase